MGLLLLSLTALALFAVLVLFSCLAVAGEADDQAELSREARRRA